MVRDFQDPRYEKDELQCPLSVCHRPPWDCAQSKQCPGEFEDENHAQKA